MNNSSNWTGRTHRTLQSAFGPYARIHTERKSPPAWPWMVGICAAVLLMVPAWM